MITIELSPNTDQKAVFEIAKQKLGVDKSQIQIYKKSIDARRKNNIRIVYSVDIKREQTRTFERIQTDKKAIIIGAGPAGLFCALYLARRGVTPIILERGDKVEEREKKVNTFLSGGSLDTDCNVQFGEGGAGTFSDGKLNTGVNNGLIASVLQDFVQCGAPEDILYLSKPHIGSDKLKPTIINLRKQIISLGGTFLFNTKVDDFIIKDNILLGVKANGVVYEADYFVLAIGHSARDTFSALYNKNVAMEAKDFAVGLRIEQLQTVINQSQYGKYKNSKNLPPADYKLVSHADTRGVFTFCMCPGGVVIPSASEENTVVVNGMSNYLRDQLNANSAVIAQVRKSDYETSHPLSGVKFQLGLERASYMLGGGNYCAPVQLAEDFISGVPTKALKGVYPTYSRGFAFADLAKIFPTSISESLKKGLYDMDGKIHGFASQGAVLTGVESRTSSPVRILRGANFESVSHKRLYPCGEGCGYAGGIMSAATDGIKVADSIVEAILNDKVCKNNA